MTAAAKAWELFRRHLTLAQKRQLTIKGYVDIPSLEAPGWHWRLRRQGKILLRHPEPLQTPYGIRSAFTVCITLAEVESWDDHPKGDTLLWALLHIQSGNEASMLETAGEFPKCAHVRLSPRRLCFWPVWRIELDTLRCAIGHEHRAPYYP